MSEAKGCPNNTEGFGMCVECADSFAGHIYTLDKKYGELLLALKTMRDAAMMHDCYTAGECGFDADLWDKAFKLASKLVPENCNYKDVEK